MEIKFNRPLARNSAADENDVRKLKKALNRLGLYTPYEKTGITEIPDVPMIAALKAFQLQHGLKASGEFKPDDDTAKELQKAVREHTGYYIWHTAGDAKVRKEHAALEGQIRNYNDAPDPGDDFNCRCWAEAVEITDAINPALGPFDLLAGGLLVKNGLRLGFQILPILEKLIHQNPKLNAKQTENLSRFIKKFLQIRETVQK